ncbi:MAG TPA: aldehyde dehydrogenase family protein [Pararhodobacter sp.]|uniref:aldehyde dehydrogenase family protein n=1 Tax=Pararhodobacter sp. TaxID=2127056 RepID=UPI001DD97A1C|nr:aldehyde dehydrogenase family protein [Pararhodobacter sp.]MCB1345195.1 aldehyde dehydrogenase family protein [Paracoccaceae bacterium]HPD93162.1 aldehyde dehydrogenase family protein [Pararhodobacter sp.]
MVDHHATFRRAQAACASRECWSPYPEMPKLYPDADTAAPAGEAAFQALLGKPFALTLPGVTGWVGEEVSPYTQVPLGITYPQAGPDALFAAAKAALPGWAAAEIDTRLMLLMEGLDRLYARLFTLVPAVMHTAGQSYNMAYAGSGVNALDRGIEALVHAEQAMRSVTPRAEWARRFGRDEIRLDKTYRLMPRGVAVCFTCASFATWNAWPSILASLATGNAVIVKPHPASVLPMAITVQVLRDLLAEQGFDPNLVTLCMDTVADPLGKVLIKHPDCAIVDFTGSARFGAWVEANAHPAIAFTETSGCNTVVLAGADDLDAAIRSLATTMCMFSAQMCTSPQNVYLPPQVDTPDGPVPRDVVARKLADAIAALTDDPRRAAMILATVQAPQTLGLIQWVREQASARGRVLLDSRAYRHPEFPQARTATPLLVQVGKEAQDLYAEERFGPIGFVIDCDSAEDALHQATEDARLNGGITGFLYARDEAFITRAETAYARAGAQLTINLTGAMPLNFAAAYSDYHVTGLNGAGNATLTTLAFVASRFAVAQSRRPARSHD